MEIELKQPFSNYCCFCWVVLVSTQTIFDARGCCPGALGHVGSDLFDFGGGVHFCYTIRSDIDCLSWLNISHKIKTQDTQSHWFGCNHVLDAGWWLTLAVNQRSNAKGITKPDNAIACDQRHHGIGANRSLVDTTNGLKNFIRWLNGVFTWGGLAVRRNFVKCVFLKLFCGF